MKLLLRLYWQQFNDHLLRCNPFFLCLFSLIVLLLIIGSWLFWYYLPLRSQIKVQEQLLATSLQQQQQLFNLNERLDYDVVEVDHLQHNVNQLLNSDVCPCELLIKKIVENASNTGLIITSLESQDVESIHFYDKKIVRLLAQGTFFQILDFLKALTAECGPLRYQTCSITRIKEGLLRIALHCMLYSTRESS